MRPVLTAFGEAVTKPTVGADWHVEFPPSRVYDFVALLVFTSKSEPGLELAVVSVEFSGAPELSWAIDVVDRDSRPLAEAQDLAIDLQVAMASDAAVAASAVRDFLEASAHLVVDALQS